MRDGICTLSLVVPIFTNIYIPIESVLFKMGTLTEVNEDLLKKEICADLEKVRLTYTYERSPYSKSTQYPNSTSVFMADYRKCKTFMELYTRINENTSKLMEIYQFDVQKLLEFFKTIPKSVITYLSSVCGIERGYYLRITLLQKKDKFFELPIRSILTS